MPRNDLSPDQQPKYDELMAKLTGDGGEEPSAEEVAGIFEEDLNDRSDPRYEEAINEVKSDYINSLVKDSEDRSLSEAQWKRIRDIEKLIFEADERQKLKTYNTLTKLESDIREGKIPGTEWLVFPQDEKELPKIAGNVFFYTQPDEYKKLKHLHDTKYLIESLIGGPYTYDGPVNAIDEQGVITEVSKKRSVGQCFADENIITAKKLYQSLDVPFDKRAKVIDKTNDFVVHNIKGYTFNTNYKKPDDPMILKYPEDVERIRRTPTQAGMQAYYTELTTQLRGIEEYEKKAKAVAAQAKELLEKLDAITKPEADGPDSDEFKDMREKLENITRLGKDMKIGNPEFRNAIKTSDLIPPGYLEDNLSYLAESASVYENKRSIFSMKSYSKKRNELSKQILSFVDSAKTRLTPSLYEGVRDVATTKTFRAEIEKKMSKLEYFRKKFGYEKFADSQRTAAEMTKKLKNCTKAVDDATVNVHMGSGAYADAQNSLRTAFNNYKSFVEAYKKGGLSIDKEALKTSLIKAKLDINKYLDYKKDNGLIKPGFVADKKTQKRIDAMNMSLENIELAYKTLDHVLEDINISKRNDFKKFLDDAGYEAESALNKAEKHFDIEAKIASAQIRLMNTEENVAEEALCDIVAANFLRAHHNAEKNVTAEDFDKVRSSIRNDERFDRMIKNHTENDLIKSASRDKGGDLLNTFMMSGPKKSADHNTVHKQGQVIKKGGPSIMQS